MRLCRHSKRALLLANSAPVEVRLSAARRAILVGGACGSGSCETGRRLFRGCMRDVGRNVGSRRLPTADDLAAYDVANGYRALQESWKPAALRAVMVGSPAADRSSAWISVA